jgi:Fe-Mn family superoxide dismutase
MEKITRRKFVEDSAKATVATAIGTSLVTNATGAIRKGATYKFSQEPIRYGYNALEPAIDAVTMDIHYNKHHAAYVKNVNEAIIAENLNYASEAEFFANASKLSPKIRNNSGGVWNHNFFWKAMKPDGGKPNGKVADSINGAFGSLEKFKEQFTTASMARFGSGWAWLVIDNKKLKIGSTPNQDNPLMDLSELKGTPLLGLDLWEHAYYLKYQNKRNEYIANWWNVVDWDEVAKQMA